MSNFLVQGGAPPDDSVTTVKVKDDAVTTAKIANDQVTLAKMAGLARGTMIYGDASGDPAALAVGAANEVLTHDGTDFDWAAAAGGGWEFVSQETAAATASIEFTSLVSGYDYQITIANMRPASDAVVMYLRVGVTGPTYRTTGYIGGGGGIASDGNGNVSAVTTYLYFQRTSQGNGANEDFRAKIDVFDPANAATKTVAVGFGQGYDSSTLTNISVGGGKYNTAEANTALEIKYQTGNITSGIFTLYRRANA